MSTLDLRPLSIGEILDRTFSLYRRNFVMFVGITAIPQLLSLAYQLTRVAFLTPRTPAAPPPGSEFLAASPVLSIAGYSGVILLAVVAFIVYFISYLFAQGGTVCAVSELYLGRTTTIGQSLSRVWGELWSLFWAILFYFVTIFFSFVLSFFLLFIPGIYMLCRLCVCIPAALLENLGPVDSLKRSFSLTKDNAGRAFLILLLYVVILYAAISLFAIPIGMGVRSAAKDPAMLRVWAALLQVGSFVAGVLVTPVLTIATSIFYFDLRVRKEAFDLQLMMNPQAAGVPAPRATGLLS
jgi:hypothetical protein